MSADSKSSSLKRKLQVAGKKLQVHRAISRSVPSLAVQQIHLPVPVSCFRRSKSLVNRCCLHPFSGLFVKSRFPLHDVQAWSEAFFVFQFESST